MSRQKVPMKDGTWLVVGYDEPFQTWFALHYDRRDPDGYVDENAPPRVAIGYHPAEQEILRGERPDAIIGSYLVSDEGLEHMLSVELLELGGEQFRPSEDQSMCWYCKKPPWQRNDDCDRHPFNQLREGP